jgi:hypothetical protein
MLDQIEITAAAQPLPRLQAVGSNETGATTTNATCAPRPARDHLGAPQPAQRQSPAWPQPAAGILARSNRGRGPVDLQPSTPWRHPLWLGLKDVRDADPAAALA